MVESMETMAREVPWNQESEGIGGGGKKRSWSLKILTECPRVIVCTVTVQIKIHNTILTFVMDFAIRLNLPSP